METCMYGSGAGTEKPTAERQKGTLYRAYIILVKLFIMFFILRLFFFPRFLNTPVVGDDKEGYVSNELIHRSLGD